QVVADRLGLPIENVDIVHGDTSKVLFGMGTYGSRSIAVGGTAIVKALDKIIAKGRKIAAHLLEASEADIEYDRGVFKVTGTDKQKTFGEVAFAAYVPHNYPLDKLEPGLNENAFYDPANFTFPAGSYVCEVEVDRDTGHGADRMALDAQGSLGDIAMHAFEYHRPSNVKDAVALVLKKEEGRYLAGGQSLVQAMKLRLSSPTDLIDLNAIGDLKALKAESSAVTIGAMVRHAEVAASSAINKSIPALASLAGMIGDRQVRHMGTIGGSIAN